MQHSNSRPLRPLFGMTHSLALVLLAVALTQSPGLSRTARAEAEDGDAIAKVTQLNRQAVEAYQAQKYDDARKLLKQALDLCSSSGLDQHPVKARTHIHLGIVIIGGFKERELGMKQFKKALEVQPDISLTKSLVTPDLQQAFDEAKADAKSDVKSETKSGGAPAAGGSPEPTEETPGRRSPRPGSTTRWSPGRAPERPSRSPSTSTAA
jgi:hypothetical protein